MFEKVLRGGNKEQKVKNKRSRAHGSGRGAPRRSCVLQRERIHTRIYSGRKAGRMSRDFPFGAEPPTQEHLSL